MRYCRFILLALIGSFLSSQLLLADSGYVGSKKCSECHAEKFAKWGETGHHLMVRTSQKAEHANLPLPTSYSWDDLSYVIGGVRQKALYLDREGFIITSSKNGKAIKSLYRLEEDRWDDYFPGEKVNYDCGPCHMTGFSDVGHQNGMRGIVGTWEEDGIGCEYCHGPGRSHIEHPYKRGLQRQPTAEVCEECHQRGGISSKSLIELGLELHHEQLNELKSGAHKGLSCLNCHNAHNRASEAKNNCFVCHSRIYNSFIERPHGKSGISCIDCHMAKVSKPAISRVSYSGDMRTHIFKINTEPNAEMFEMIEEKNKESLFYKGFITVEFVCLNCHGSHDKAWAEKNAKNFHD